MNKDQIKEYVLRDAENMRSLSFSENYIRESILNTERWAKTGLLAGVPDPYIGRQLSKLLENQRQQNENENSPMPENVNSDWNEAKWKRVSIPAVRRVFGSFLPYHLVSVQSLNKQEDRMYYTGLDERQNSLIIEAKSRSFGRYWWDSKTDENYELEKEAEDLAAFSERYSVEVSREVIRDLTTNAGSIAPAAYKDQDHLLSLIEGMSAYISAKIKGREATWIVANPVVTELLKPFVTEWQDGKSHIEYRGMVNNKWKLYEDNLMATSKVLMGHKDNSNHYFSGYFYCPYRPFIHRPSWWTENTHGHGTLHSLVGKRLLEPNFYGVIELSDLPEQQKEEGE